MDSQNNWNKGFQIGEAIEMEIESAQSDRFWTVCLQKSTVSYSICQHAIMLKVTALSCGWWSV